MVRHAPRTRLYHVFGVQFPCQIYTVLSDALKGASSREPSIVDAGCGANAVAIDICRGGHRLWAT